jgi:hypothetical protein
MKTGKSEFLKKMPVWLDILFSPARGNKKRACIFAPAGAADPQVYV